MANRNHAHKHRRNSSQIIAMALIGAGLLVIGVVALIALPRNGVSAQGQEKSAIPAIVDFSAPDLALSDLQGNPTALSDYRGQWVLVNNWATWCPPCKAEMPTLQAYYEAHRDKGFVIIAIDAGDPIPEVADFVKSYGLTFPVWPDPQETAIDAFRNNALPSSYLIDPQGTVRLAWNGAISRSVLERYVTPLLEE
jgi:thiol-disulfide isomerase/thioredoxin